MTQTWNDDSGYPHLKLTPLGYVIALLRGIPLAILAFGGLLVLLLIRAIERPFFGLHRPWTPFVSTFVCRNALRVLQIPIETIGQPSEHRGAVVANHTSWLDIFALNSFKRIYFVSKEEVRNWPGIGWLARATGTLFIRRDPKLVQEQTQLFEARLLAGHRLLFFPEGTSTDGRRVLPFKTALFESFLTPTLKDEIWVQPVAVVYHAPPGKDPRFYGWWGDMSFGGHLMATLAVPRQGRIQVLYLDPIRVRDAAHRKDLARRCEGAIRSAFEAQISPASNTSGTAA